MGWIYSWLTDFSPWGLAKPPAPAVTRITAHDIRGLQSNLSPYLAAGVAEPRLAVLDPEFEALYPELPAGQWVPALKVAAWQADRLWLEQGAGALRDRVLPDKHFRFRGGIPRTSEWYIMPERLCDRTLPELGNVGSESGGGREV
jgi:hypothetical protein